jgi:hypothetical protein
MQKKVDFRTIVSYTVYNEELDTQQETNIWLLLMQKMFKQLGRNLK